MPHSGRCLVRQDKLKVEKGKTIALARQLNKSVYKYRCDVYKNKGYMLNFPPMQYQKDLKHVLVRMLRLLSLSRHEKTCITDKVLKELNLF